MDVPFSSVVRNVPHVLLEVILSLKLSAGCVLASANTTDPAAAAIYPRVASVSEEGGRLLAEAAIQGAALVAWMPATSAVCTGYIQL